MIGQTQFGRELCMNLILQLQMQFINYSVALTSELEDEHFSCSQQETVQQLQWFLEWVDDPKMISELTLSWGWLNIWKGMMMNKIAVGNLTDKMAEYIGIMSMIHMILNTRKLSWKKKKHFGDKIIITEINGMPNVVTFYSTAERILQEVHKTEIDSPEDKAQYIIKSACKLIRKDISDIEQDRETYPSYGEMSLADNALDYLP